MAFHTQQHAKGNTENGVDEKVGAQPLVKIENLNFTQNTQSRPRRLIRGYEDSVEDEKSEVVEVQQGFCKFPNCGEKAFGKVVWLKDNKELPFCYKHFVLAESNRKLYKIVKVKEVS